ncbi:cytochrome P450 [Myceligenerans indicum]|uniref:Cytochrome P450 n=1 Tax=Myceligenerans indicum TaxID=2593663 RepID=A0ABS1LQH7_9MICO|nr:cytochrome P450 [Myceligenerans indicum]MBL0888541.1 cytochrome P450 [Myceligenerans indicum]
MSVNVLDEGILPPQLTTVRDLDLLSVTTSGPDPQAAYARLQEQWGMVAPVEIEPGVPAWLVMGHPEICAIARDETNYSRDPRNWRWHRDGLLAADAAILAYCPPEPRNASFHHDGETRARLRQALDDALAALPEKAVVEYADTVCTRIIGELPDSGPLDLVADYGVKVGFLSMAAVFGFDHATATRLMADSMIISKLLPGALEARQRIGQVLMEHVRSRRGTPGRDLTTLMADHPGLESDLEVIDSIAVPVHGAASFVGAFISRTLHLLVADARFAERWGRGRLHVDEALDEVLWRDTPVPNAPAPRFAMVDHELDGKLVRAGDAIVLAVSAANHDPRVHTGDPWDEVGNRSHLAWSLGPHACPAPRQARLITRTAVQRVLRDLDVHLAVSQQEIRWAPSPWARHPVSLPVNYHRRAG